MENRKMQPSNSKIRSGGPNGGAMHPEERTQPTLRDEVGGEGLEPPALSV